MAIDHDQIHKTLIEHFFREFMELFCPQEAALIDFAVVEFLREEYFTDIMRGRKRVLDLVAKVRLKDGSERFILVHIEFESRRRTVDFPKRMFEYFCQLFLRHGTDVVAVAVFTDRKAARKAVPEKFELAFSEKSSLRFNYHVIKLSNLDYRAFLNSKNPLAYALMAKMNWSRREIVRHKADFLRMILGAGIDPARQSLLLEYVETYMPLVASQQTEFEQLIETDSTYKEVEKMVTTYERAGIEKGRLEGRVEGRLSAKQEVLVGLLRKRFHRVPQRLVRKIQQTQDDGRLDELIFKTMDMENLADLGL